MRRLLACVLTAAAFSLLAAGTALAGPQSMANGGGQTHDGAAFGFNAKDDQSGDFSYVGVTQTAVTVSGVNIPAGSRFQGHCFDYSMVNFISPTQARLFGECRGMFWVDGGPPVRGDVFIQAHVIDNGEPGTDDRACIAWGLQPSPKQNAADTFVFDCGVIQNGNIQVKPA